ncbi:SIR2 family NAD-dependent protein deacylase [Anaerobaca lacustris]|uniref:SIR2 family protein n=1 Tax=Anaerobaca lacustris TaxID=3044600 RepID=A0AAW6U632_9BACT|nr:SIR2 family protein [Sedimentisphaerales bacterium M17dextr]
MAHIEDPNRQVGYLQQCLSSDKKPIGLFLGAGCPMAVKTGTDGKQPLIPDIAGITKIVCDELSKCKDCGPLLTTVQGHFTNDGRDNPTVEDMLTHIRALRAVAGKDQVRGLCADKLDQLDKRVCTLIHQIVDKALPDTETPYHRIAAWVDAVRRENPIEVFTTNYDLLMEQAFEDCCVPYFDGFAGVRKPFFDLRAMEEDMLPPRWARLWKLHGSVNWYQVANKGVFRGTASNDGDLKRVIHPSHLKYQESRRMPYLAMIDRLRAFLKKPTATLILCGYSFRDEHINEVIVQGLQCTQTAVAFALMFDKASKCLHAMPLAANRPNLNVLARDGGVIGGQESAWPEKDAESVSSDAGRWVTWIPVDPTNDKAKRRAEFALGDFAVFGQFLQELVGAVRQPLEVPSGK